MILSKSQLVNNINSEISDQSYGQISPYDIRHNLLDIIDSVHNLTLAHNLSSLNFATFSDGNTKVGENALDNLEINGSLSEYNTAIGYNSLRSNYRGIKNTAVGSYSLSCNVYGENNVALGNNALAGNTVGHYNVGLGSYTLNNNKSGNGNIAIGHGAGYYVNKNTSHKLFIAYHPVDGASICANPLGSGLTPLVYGDLHSIKFGIGVRSLHSYGMLQVGGDISPSGNGVLNIGHPLYNWNTLYLSNSLRFPNNTRIENGDSSSISIQGNLLPKTNNLFLLGKSDKKWSHGHFQNLTVAGSANINQLFTISTQNYSDTKFYLGVDASLNPLNSDEGLFGGGVIFKSTSGRSYSINYYPPSSGMPCFSGEYNQSVFRSNISFQVPRDGYLKVNNIVSYEPESFSEGDCYGLFFNSGITYVSRKNVLDVNPGSPSGHIAGIGNVNLLSNSGEFNDYVVSVSSLEPGVSVSHRLISGTKSREKDIANNNKDKLRGFEFKYIDDSNAEIQGSLTDRLVIGSYDNTSKFVNGLVVMKNDIEGAVLGVTNIQSVTENVLPKTIFNIRSKDNCVSRFTAENNGYYKSSIQLLAPINCELSGVELSYANISGIFDISMYKDSGNSIFVRMKDTNEIGILSSGITNSAITIGHSGMQQLPVISLKDDTFVNNSGVIASSGYGKIYNLRDIRSYANQFNSLFYSDTSGNQFNLVVNKLDNLDARAVYTDTNRNTFAGYLSPSGRSNINAATKENTAYGEQSLYSIRSGSGNIAIGYGSLRTLSSGNNNIVIGESLSGISNTSHNIVIGNKSYYQSTNTSTNSNIIIGHSLVPYYSGSYNFLLGNLNRVLLQGTLGPNDTDKKLIMPSGGRLYINNNNDTDSLCLKANTIEVIDSGGNNYPDNILTFKFIANNSFDLLSLNHNAAPLSNTPLYNVLNNNQYLGRIIDSVDPRPRAELNGDLRLRGIISFSDGTILGTSSGITTAIAIGNSGIALGNSGIAIANSGISIINSAIIEGYMPSGLAAPSSFGLKTSGIMIIKDAMWADSGSVFIINRDVTSVIHSGAYVIASRINNEYKPIWVSAADTSCLCCNN